MKIFPAIDLYEGKAVRLYKGRYDDLTVYSDDPAQIGEDFATKGAEAIHIVDLEGARDGTRRISKSYAKSSVAADCFARSAAASEAWRLSTDTWTPGWTV